MKRLASMSWYIVTVALLVACDGGPTDAPVYNQLASHASPRSAAISGWHSILSVVGNDLPVTSWRRSVLTVVRDAGERGVYVGEFSGTSTEGYPIDNPRNRAPTCGIGGVYNPNDIAVDGVGNLIIPAGSNNTIKIFKGPAMCGPEVGSIGDPYGQPVDATSPNALIKTIAVANIFDTSGGGSISLCTMAGGCTKNLTNLEMNEVAAVANGQFGELLGVRIRPIWQSDANVLCVLRWAGGHCSRL